jgi:hypothetical protein
LEDKERGDKEEIEKVLERKTEERQTDYELRNKEDSRSER